MKKLFIIIIFLSFAGTLYSQTDTSSDDGVFSIIAKEDGLRFVYNSSGSHFQFDLKCDEFKPIEAENLLFMVDGVLLQITPVPAKELFGKMASNMNDSLALIYHFAYEARTIRNSLSGDYKIEPEFILSPSGRLLYYWSFRMPDTHNAITDSLTNKIVLQMYATTYVGNRILMLSSALISKNKPDEVKKKFIDLFDSIKMSKGKIDPERVSKELVEQAKKAKEIKKDK